MTRNEIEKRYAEKHESIIDALLEIENIISILKKEQTIIPDETINDNIDICLFHAMEAKNMVLKLNENFYEAYNKIYKDAE